MGTAHTVLVTPPRDKRHKKRVVQVPTDRPTKPVEKLPRCGVADLEGGVNVIGEARKKE